MRLRNVGALLALAAGLGLTSCKPEEAKSVHVAPPAHAQAPTIAQPAATPKVQETVQPKADPVDALIAQVEKEYQAGRANYAAGHLDAAKDNFDRAFNMLLLSGLDIRNDERL